MSTTPLIISTSMYCDSPEESTTFPSAGADSSDSGFQSIYWRCVCVFFKTARFFNPEAHLILFTNLNVLPNIGEFSITNFLNTLGVEIITLGRYFILPKGFTNKFGNCFYKLDCLRYFSTQPYEVETSILLLDNDIVVTDSLNELSNLVNHKQYVFYRISDPTQFNGLQQEEIKQLFTEENNHISSTDSVALGGEFIAFTSSVAQKLDSAIGVAFNHSIERFHNKKKHLMTEEHIYAYINLDLNFHILESDTNSFIRRIWTGKFNNRLPDDINRALWHLPREKRYGFKRLFKTITGKNNQKTTLSKVSIGRVMGIPRATIIKKLLDNLTFFTLKTKYYLLQVFKPKAGESL